MGRGVAWVDEVCRALDLRHVSGWLPWNQRETGEALGAADEPEGTAGVYLLARGGDATASEVVYVGATGRARIRLSRLENQVKWGMEHGFGPLRDVLEENDDHRTMNRVHVNMIRVDEVPLFRSALLTDRRLNATGAARRQLATILLAEHYCRFGIAVPGNRDTRGLFLRDAPPSRPSLAA